MKDYKISRFPVEKLPTPDPVEKQEDVEDLLSGPRMEMVNRHVLRLPNVEQDFLRLYYTQGLRQDQIAKLFGISQSAVAYRLKRAKKRLQFLLVLPEFTLKELTHDLKPFLTSRDIQIMWSFYQTTSQSATGRQFKQTQGHIRYIILRTIRKLTELRSMEIKMAKNRKSVFEPYITAFELLIDRRGQLHTFLNTSQYNPN